MNWDPFTPGRPGRRGEGSGMCQSLSDGGDIGGFGYTEGGGGGDSGGNSGWSGNYSYGTQVCWYSFHICHP